MSELSECSVRVSTLELFFELVFVITITQLTGVLVEASRRRARASRASLSPSRTSSSGTGSW
jgi:low temperature requirement protein LtrA